MSVSAAIRKMIELGLSVEHALLAAGIMEAELCRPAAGEMAVETHSTKSAQALRQQRYRERKAIEAIAESGTEASPSVTRDVTSVTGVTTLRLVTDVTSQASQSVTNVTLLDTPGLDKESPPEPPKEINPTPKKHTVRNHSKPNASPTYPAEFGLLWREFAFHPNASKKDAFAAWQKLPEEDRDKCLDGAMAYGRFLQSERQRRPDYPALHLATFINQRRFDSLLEQRQ